MIITLKFSKNKEINYMCIYIYIYCFLNKTLITNILFKDKGTKNKLSLPSIILQHFRF